MQRKFESSPVENGKFGDGGRSLPVTTNDVPKLRISTIHSVNEKKEVGIEVPGRPSTARARFGKPELERSSSLRVGSARGSHSSERSSSSVSAVGAPRVLSRVPMSSQAPLKMRPSTARARSGEAGGALSTEANPYVLPETWRYIGRPQSAKARIPGEAVKSVKLAAKAQAKLKAQRKAEADAKEKAYLESLAPEERAAIVVDKQIKLLRRDVLPVMARSYPSIFGFKASSSAAQDSLSRHAFLCTNSTHCTRARTQIHGRSQLIHCICVYSQLPNSKRCTS